ncbi:hypothetical protein EN866_34860 [Mesorhizobium sp. M2D.F.Ca.ET.223.01.1.1]|uniref:hypothetical protein n=1 Tax=Mesorhizobium sp. M2D.F.Ca.ET.223.01.1.1 TaxID=2563940 RepID=UPI001092F62C|nr:hypothetical protein [Mesorhizobium sp. M2D.F.Ca.ET.223.01.1.1]TGR82328.1 hypothetical protein EN866_34860 [Mesorhizobium sp. M2D.F.Ca.ET.223.01.1.1]TGT64481.1 hypothetical protein EN802_32350 [bacterium M00.F.Ca.ET.159.01.1.1]TGT79326.1 hypothetical protein EN800_31690 [bacterium M00.F.Ca.ET.157.01.1.1]
MGQAILDELLRVLDEDHAHAVIEHRRVTIRKPLTAYGAKRLASKFAAWGDANEAADIMIDRLWQGFECEWVKDRRRPQGRRNHIDAALDAMKETNGPASIFGRVGNA